MKRGDLVLFRTFEPDDLHFILSTWLRGLRYGNKWFEMIESDTYYNMYKPVVQKVLANPLVTVNVACLREQPDVILSYSVTQEGILHWLFTKGAWRRMGLANDLIPPDTKTMTHITGLGESFIMKKKNLTFNPFLL